MPPLGVTSFHPVYLQKSGLVMEPPPQPKRGEGSHESHLPVPDGGFPEKSGGGSNGDWGVSGAFHRRGGPPWSVRHTETVILARVHTGAQPLLESYGEG